MKLSMKLVYAIFVAANILLFFGSLAISRTDLVILNLASGTLCALGYHLHSRSK